MSLLVRVLCGMTGGYVLGVLAWKVGSCLHLTPCVMVAMAMFSSSVWGGFCALYRFGR